MLFRSHGGVLGDVIGHAVDVFNSEGGLVDIARLASTGPLVRGIGGTLGFLAAVIGLGTILGKMMEVSGAAERIGLTLQRCRWLSADVIMVLVGLICGITLFVEVGVVLLIPLAFSIAKKTHTSLLKLAIPLCTALMAVHCVVPPHPAALFVTNKLGADVGTVIVVRSAVRLLARLLERPGPATGPGAANCHCRRRGWRRKAEAPDHLH